MDGFVLFLIVSSCFGFGDGKPIKPKKVAILGGGPVSCATALALTGQPGWKERYDVTIYQLGWRLGGKARSGRNKNYGQRSEGIAGHHFPSTYIETKKLLRSVYKELSRPEGAPLRTFEKAFKSKSFWTGQDMNCGMDTKCFSVDYLFEKLIETFLVMREKIIKELKIDYIIKKEHYIPESIFLKSQVASLQALLKSTLSTLKGNSTTKEYFLIIDTVAAVITGILEDNLLDKGMHTINNIDLHQWLKKHGASETAINSSFLLAHYDEAMAYINGDIQKPDMEAGSALQLFLPIYFCCEETITWDQEAGLGDAIFAPFYEVLKRRGVHFKFFHKVEELVLNNNSNLVEKIRMTKQVRLLTEEYNPLVNVKGLPSWPNEPKYEEIIEEQAYLLQTHNIDLESFWSNWSTVYEESFGHPLPEVFLKRGKDFDIIVYGIPVGSLPSLCAQLLEKNPSLKATNGHIDRLPSFQLQFWGTAEFEDYMQNRLKYRLLNAQHRKHYIIFYNDDLLESEDWKSQGLEPKHLLYITSMQNISHFKIPSSNNVSFAEEMMKKMRGFYMETLLDALRSISPNSFQNGNFNWTVLTDPMNRTGVERFDSQYVD